MVIQMIQLVVQWLLPGWVSLISSINRNYSSYVCDRTVNLYYGFSKSNEKCIRHCFDFYTMLEWKLMLQVFCFPFLKTAKNENDVTSCHYTKVWLFSYRMIRSHWIFFNCFEQRELDCVWIAIWHFWNQAPPFGEFLFANTAECRSKFTPELQPRIFFKWEFANGLHSLFYEPTLHMLFHNLDILQLFASPQNL